MKKKIIIVLSILLLSISFSLKFNNVEANGIPYGTYTYSSSSKRFIWTQDAYVPLSIQYDLNGIVLEEPEDITIDSKNNVYIVDSGLKAVIKYSLETDETKIIGKGVLKKPTGAHVGYDDKLYIADAGNNQAYQFTYNDELNDYEVTKTYSKPKNTPYFSDTDSFEPTKVVTDHANIVYLVLAGNHNGLAKFDDDSEFIGFFGSNQLPKTLMNLARQFLFDEKQRRDWFKMVPKPIYNVGVDDDGLILTTTKTLDGYKKLNIANHVYNESVWGFDDNEDIFVGPNKTTFVISSNGSIVEYSPEGETLFVFSGKDDFNQKGLFKNPKGLAVDSKNNIYVIDNYHNSKSLQVFIPTEFANTVHEAIMLYYDGRYSESLEPWQKVLKMNALFDLANKGIGDAYFAQLNYKSAMQYYTVARDQNGYSQAYWEVRNQQLLTSGTIIVVVVLSLIVLIILNTFLKFGKYLKYPFAKLNTYLKKFKIYNELIYGFYIIKSPADGYYGIKREKKSSNITALIYVMLFFLAYMFWKYNTSFLFNDVVKAEIKVVNEMMFVFLPMIFFVLSNYLIGNIKDGEGKTSDIFQGMAYSLLPAIITLPIVSIISNYLTYNESFIYNTLFYVGIGITLIYLFIMVKEIHFYDMKPTISNVLLTIFTALMILVFIIIVYMLFNEVIGLIRDIIKEVTSRV